MTLGIGAAALVGGAAAIGGGLIAANGAKSAASAQGAAATNSLYNTMQQEAFNENNELPYVQTGSWAEQQYQNGLGTGEFGGNFNSAPYGGSTFTPQDYLDNQDPGYQFQLQQGQQALQNSQAAQDGILSGSALKGLIGYNQGMASTGYQNAYNRWLSTNQNAFNQWQSTQNQNYNQLSGLMSLGQNAAAQVGNSGAQYNNTASNAAQNIGNAAASGAVGSANALSSGISNGAGYYAINSLVNQANQRNADTSASNTISSLYNSTNGFADSDPVPNSTFNPS